MMRQIKTGVLASAIAFGVAGAGFGWTGASAAMAANDTRAAGRAAAAQAEPFRVQLLEIEGKVLERPSPFAWMSSSSGDKQRTVRDLAALFESAARRNNLDAFVVRLIDAELSRAQIEELGRAMDAFRKEGGKKIFLYAENYGPTELLMGAHADRVILQSGGAVSLPGIYMEEMYLADTLAWAGVRADFVQVGDYKGASEPLARSAPSKEWDENVESLLDGLYGAMRAQLRKGRSLSDEQLDEAMRRAWMTQGEEAIRVGLIDAEVDLPELTDYLKSGADGRSVAWVTQPSRQASRRAESQNPFAIFQMLSRKPENTPRRDTIAVLHIDGGIVDGESSDGGLFGGSSVGGRTVRKALGEIEENDLIKGVVVRVNSPGGSAVASEMIWQGIQRVAEKKPVWVSIGDMAASGGYYVAVAGERIYLNPSSIVGSIGVVGGKLAMGDLLEQKLKVNVVGRGRGPMASMMSSTETWSEAERALVREKMQEIYDLFTQRVTQGRNGINLDQTAAGRLFVGQRAVELGMADQIGSLGDTLRDLAARLELQPGAYDVMDYPGPKSFEELLERMFGSFMAAPGGVRGGGVTEFAQLARELLGERTWAAVSANVSALMQLRSEPVLLTTPRVLIIK